MAGKSTISITFKLDGDSREFKDLARDADGLKKAMSGAVSEAKKFNADTINFAAFATGVDNLQRSMTQLQGMVSGLASEYETFDRSMRKVNTMAGENAQGLKDLKKEVEALSATVPMVKDQLANGLYQVISNGVPKDNWISFLEKSSRAAVGGVADLEQTVIVTSTVIKNYGLEWEAAGEIQDKIQMTAKNGVTSFEQLAAALPKVTGSAAALNVSVDELLGSFATLTGVSGNTAEVATQLQAIFTALIRPSEQAAKMAERMGIKFDAAAIKAAGGMKNFLTQLASDVSAFSASTGMLETQVYAKLFGSAEALRALIPITGELSDKYSSNVEAMASSSGSIDAAFKDMAGSGQAVRQMLKNQIGTMFEWAGSTASAVQPFVLIAANATGAIAGVTTLARGLRTLLGTMTLTSIKAKGTAVAMGMMGLKASRSAAVTRVFSAAMKGAAYQAVALKIALRGLMIATGVGAAIVALTAVIEHLTGASEGGSEEIGKLTDAQEEFKSASAEMTVRLDEEKKMLQDLISANGDEAEAVGRMNQMYGKAFGIHKTASDWYDVLTKKSKIYAQQVGYEAQARLLSTKMAELQIEKQFAQERLDAFYKKAKEEREKGGAWYDIAGGSVSFRDITKAKDEVAGLDSQIASVGQQLDFAAGKLDEFTRKMGDMKTPELVVPRVAGDTGAGSPGGEKNEVSGIIATLEQQIADARQRLKEATSEDVIEAINKEIQGYESELDRYRNLGVQIGEALGEGVEDGIEESALAWNANASTLKDITANIDILNERLQTASVAEAASINQSIALWEAKADAIRNAGKEAEKTTVSVYDGAISSWSAVKNVGDSIVSVTEALKGNQNAWQILCQIVDGFIGIYEGVKAIIDVINMMTSASETLTAAKTAQAVAETTAATAAGAESAVGVQSSAAVIAANSAEAASWQALAAAKIMAAHASIPFAGVVIAGGYIAAMKAILATAAIPAFADGGIVSGPTLAMVGEYGGASSNPEIIAPLDRLRSLISPSDGNAGKVEFKIQGRYLVGILDRELSVRKRS